MERELIAVQRAVGITFIFVTHSQQEALALSHRIAVMNAGRIEQVGSPEEIYGAPKNRFVADFIGTINLLPASVGAGMDRLRLSVPGLGAVAGPAGDAAPGQAGYLALRPEQIRLAAPGGLGGFANRFAGRVAEAIYLGDVTLYKVALAAGPALETLLANSAAGRGRVFEIGDAVEVGWNGDAGRFLTD